MTKFENIIKNNAQKYYTDGTQNISDAFFDALVDEVKKSNSNSNVLNTGWGYNVENEKYQHIYKHIGSLDKVRNDTEILSKMKGAAFECNVAAKLDGISVVLYYVNGILYKALTRGDGEWGIDITHKVLTISDSFNFVCDDKNNMFTGAVRGEIFMTPKNFEKYKKNYPDAKNARNSTAGIINSKEINVQDYKYLSLNVYTIIHNKNNYYTIKGAYERLERLFGKINVVPYKYVYNFDIGIDNLKSYYNELKEQVEVDGLVITTDIDEELNYNQFAVKFETEVKVATVSHIEWTASKHNTYIPVIVFEESIELNGTQVSRATGYNAKWVKDMNIKSGCIVSVHKANMIIPEILEVIE